MRRMNPAGNGKSIKHPNLDNNSLDTRILYCRFAHNYYIDNLPYELFHMKYILNCWNLHWIVLVISVVLTACDPAPKRFLVDSSGSFKSSDGVTEGFRSTSVDSYPTHEECMEALKKRKSGDCVDQQYLDSMQDNLQLIPNSAQ
jgi:hypothetical protein